MYSFRKYISEGIGTMFLVILACGSAVLAGPSIGGLGIGLCFGLVLVCLCYCIGNISGCHVNPAVSLAMYLSGRMKGLDCVAYIIFQLFGAAVGAGFLYWFMQSAPDFNFGGITGANNLATNVLQKGATMPMALMSEALLTFFFVLVVLGPPTTITASANSPASPSVLLSAWSTSWAFPSTTARSTPPAASVPPYSAPMPGVISGLWW